MQINSTLQKLFENELQASAAGFPGAQDDLVTYTQIDMILNSNNPNFEEEITNILLRKKESINNKFNPYTCF